MKIYTKEDLKDERWVIRRAAYRALGYNEQALKDGGWLVRLEAYRTLGFTEQALRDEESYISQEAETYLNFMNDTNIENAPMYLNDENEIIALAAKHMLEKGI